MPCLVEFSVAGTFLFDGRVIPFEDGDTIASALWRQRVLTVSRSMKYHRPRGATCMTGNCAGCMVTVQDAPNRLACLEPARSDLQVEGQNALGSVAKDLFRVTDYVFPTFFDPHRFLTKPKVVNDLFLRGVRFMSGMGEVPSTPLRTTGTTQRKSVDTLVVGGGIAGIQAAQAAAKRGESVLLVEENGELGWLSKLYGTQIPSVQQLEQAGIEVLLGANCFGLYEDGAGIEQDGNLWWVTSKHQEIHVGTYDDVVLVPGNELPGILSERAFRLLGSKGALPVGTYATVGDPLDSELPFEVAPSIQLLDAIPRSDVKAIRGGSRVEGLETTSGRIRCDFVIVNLPPIPRMELHQQLGRKLIATPTGELRIEEAQA